MAVLFAAALHASWNSIVKSGTGRLQSIILISLFAAGISAFILPFVPFPQAAAWPWLLASVGLHIGYKMFLVLAYRAGDMGQVYAIARGTAPLLVAAGMFLVFDESLSLAAMGGMLLLVTGVLLMCVRGGHEAGRFQLHAVLFALTTSIFIALYTIADGIGARRNGSALGYAPWMFFLDGCFMLAILVLWRGSQGLRIIRHHWQTTALGGAMMLASYWTVIWAMTVMPIALVSALRESSVLFGVLLSVLLLKEPLTRWRVISVIAVVTGVVIMRLA